MSLAALFTLFTLDLTPKFQAPQGLSSLQEQSRYLFCPEEKTAAFDEQAADRVDDNFF